MLLDLSKNQLFSLPSEIGECKRLTDLYLDDNQIGSLPESIGKLTICSECNKKKRYYQFYQLKKKGQLTSLTILKLDTNRLTRLPITIGG